MTELGCILAHGSKANKREKREVFNYVKLTRLGVSQVPETFEGISPVPETSSYE